MKISQKKRPMILVMLGEVARPCRALPTEEKCLITYTTSLLSDLTTLDAPDGLEVGELQKSNASRLPIIYHELAKNLFLQVEDVSQRPCGEHSYSVCS